MGLFVVDLARAPQQLAVMVRVAAANGAGRDLTGWDAIDGARCPAGYANRYRMVWALIDSWWLIDYGTPARLGLRVTTAGRAGLATLGIIAPERGQGTRCIASVPPPAPLAAVYTQLTRAGSLVATYAPPEATQ